MRELPLPKNIPFSNICWFFGHQPIIIMNMLNKVLWHNTVPVIRIYALNTVWHTFCIAQRTELQRLQTKNDDCVQVKKWKFARCLWHKRSLLMLQLKVFFDLFSILFFWSILCLVNNKILPFIVYIDNWHFWYQFLNT